MIRSRRRGVAEFWSLNRWLQRRTVPLQLGLLPMGRRRAQGSVPLPARVQEALPAANSNACVFTSFFYPGIKR